MRLSFLSYQWFGFLFIFVIIQPIRSQNKPATVPRFDESPLLPEPPTPDDTQATVHLALSSTVLGAVVGRALLIHHGSSDLQKKKKKSDTVDIKLLLSIKLKQQIWHQATVFTKQLEGADFIISYSVNISALFSGRCRCSGPAAFSSPSVTPLHLLIQMRTRWHFQQLSSAASAARLGCGDLKKKKPNPRTTNMPAMHVCRHVRNMLSAGEMAVCCLFCCTRSTACICFSHVGLGFGEKWAGLSVG